jgi:hypothetical protein
MNAIVLAMRLHPSFAKAISKSSPNEGRRSADRRIVFDAAPSGAAALCSKLLTAIARLKSRHRKLHSKMRH